MASIQTTPSASADGAPRRLFEPADSSNALGEARAASVPTTAPTTAPITAPMPSPPPARAGVAPLYHVEIRDLLNEGFRGLPAEGAPAFHEGPALRDIVGGWEQKTGGPSGPLVPHPGAMRPNRRAVYHRRLAAYGHAVVLGEMNMTLTLLHLRPLLVGPVDEMRALEEAWIAAYEAVGAVVVPPTARRWLALGAHQARRYAPDAEGGPYGFPGQKRRDVRTDVPFLARAEAARALIMGSGRREEILNAHAEVRAGALEQGATGLNPWSVAVLEWWADYLVLQAATRADVRAAVDTTLAGGLVSHTLELMDRRASLAFEEAVAATHTARALEARIRPRLSAMAIEWAERRPVRRLGQLPAFAPQQELKASTW